MKKNIKVKKKTNNTFLINRKDLHLYRGFISTQQKPFLFNNVTFMFYVASFKSNFK